jgi:hypothetical protein
MNPGLSVTAGGCEGPASDNFMVELHLLQYGALVARFLLGVTVS